MPCAINATFPLDSSLVTPQTDISASLPFFPDGVAATVPCCVSFVGIAADRHLAQRVLLGYETSVFEVVTLLDPNKQGAGRHTNHVIWPCSRLYWSRC